MSRWLKFLMILPFAMASSAAMADYYYYHYHYGYGYEGGYYYHPRPVVVRTGGALVLCSPEAQQQNLDRIEGTLNEMAQSPDFADAQTYKTTIANIQASGMNATDRINAYLELMEATSDEDVVAIMGGQTDKAIAAAKKNLKLTDQQTQELVNQLRASMRQGLK